MGGAGISEALAVLQRGRIEVLGLLPYSSNYTFLARVDDLLAVYKPRRGERPLWDFPAGTLAARERAAFVVSEAAGWHIVPPTILRDGPLGDGSLQLFVEHDPDKHFFVLMEERLDEFRAFAAFDAVVNNADRKAGHVLEGPDGRVWAVDHGVSFHTEPKLRTVIWQFAEEPLGEDVRTRLEQLGSAVADPDGVGGELERLLSAEEAAATLARVETLLVEDRFPSPVGDRPLPWPLI
ncbi:MAG TPA: SCO1664 family protein [Actinomycetota bacterium]|nr:SCO1664 family protein [Actinomycetota bacterium]